MSQLHATFSGGLLAAALLTSGVTAVTGSVPAHSRRRRPARCSCSRAPARACWRTSRRARGPGGAEAARPPGPARRHHLLMGCAMAFGTITEGAMNDWSTRSTWRTSSVRRRPSPCWASRWSR
ncbi:hypothetical protein LT493_30170 [Streptomyces tricolor]|nr:hypothetical protein [Streptomyces tricolor]